MPVVIRIKQNSAGELEARQFPDLESSASFAEGVLLGKLCPEIFSRYHIKSKGLALWTEFVYKTVQEINKAIGAEAVASAKSRTHEVN